MRQMPKLVIESRFEQVWIVGVMVRAVAGQLGFGHTETHHLELAMVEAVNNTIEHAYRSEDDRLVEVSLGIQDRELEFTITDYGVALPSKMVGGERLALSESDGTGFVEKLAEGGRGLLIIAQVMDSVRYEHCGARNQLHLTKRRPAAA